MRSYDLAAVEICSMRPPAKPFLANTLVAARRMLSRVAWAASSRTPGRRVPGDLAATLRRDGRLGVLAMGACAVLTARQGPLGYEIPRRPWVFLLGTPSFQH